LFQINSKNYKLKKLINLKKLKKRGVIMTEPHRHCAVCGTPIPPKEVVCSDKCQKLMADRQKKVMRTRRIIYAVFAVFIIIWLYIMFRGQI